MSSFSDLYKDQERAAFVKYWCPGDIPAATDENLRWNIAKRRAAEHELREIKTALKTLKAAVR